MGLPTSKCVHKRPWVEPHLEEPALGRLRPGSVSCWDLTQVWPAGASVPAADTGPHYVQFWLPWMAWTPAPLTRWLHLHVGIQRRRLTGGGGGFRVSRWASQLRGEMPRCCASSPAIAFLHVSRNVYAVIGPFICEPSNIPCRLALDSHCPPTPYPHRFFLVGRTLPGFPGCVSCRGPPTGLSPSERSYSLGDGWLRNSM